MSELLVATDLSPRAERAQRRATLLARRNGLALRLVHVIDADQPAALIDAHHQHAQSILQRLADTIETDDGVACTATIRHARGIDEGIRNAVTTDTRALVVGRHRPRLLRDLFLGGTSERIIAHAPCPVLVAQAAPIEAYHRLVVGTDLSAPAQSGLEALAACRLFDDAAMDLVHVIGSTDQAALTGNRMSDGGRDRTWADEKAHATAAVQQLARDSALGAVGEHVEVDTRPVAVALVALAEREGGDLLVTCPRERTASEKLLRYSVTRRLLNDSPTDLLIV